MPSDRIRGLIAAAALRERRIAGAALDIPCSEPLAPDHPVRRPDSLVAPRIGYVTRDRLPTCHRDVAADGAGWLGGKPVRVLSGPAGAARHASAATKRFRLVRFPKRHPQCAAVARMPSIRSGPGRRRHPADEEPAHANRPDAAGPRSLFSPERVRAPLSV